MKKEELKRQVFDKDKFSKTVNTGFEELSNKPDPKFFDIDLATIDDFFNLYEKLFFDIPKEGENNSHEFLVKESVDYIGLEPIFPEIQVLLEEITELKEENIELREEIRDLVDRLSTSSSKTKKIIDNISSTPRTR